MDAKGFKGDQISDLISRQKAIDALKVAYSTFAVTPTQKGIVEDCLEIIKHLPSARPIGKWELQENEHVENIYLCSNCRNYEAWGETEKTPYCPHCGAWMEV